MRYWFSNIATPAPRVLFILLLLAGAACGSDGDGESITEPPETAFSGSLVQQGIGVAPEQRRTSDLWVHGDFAYTGTHASSCAGGTCSDSRLYVWNVATPAQPELVDSLVFDGAILNDVKVSADGRFAVVTHEGSATDGNGISLLDLSDPAKPAAITRYTQRLENGVHNVWIERISGRDYVFVVEDDGSGGGLHILDVSDLAAPREVAQFYGGSSIIHDVYVRDGLAFVSHWDAGLVILDVGNGVRGGSPSSPVEISRVTTPNGNVHNAWYWPERKLVFVGEENFNAAETGQMRVVDVANLAQPRVVASYAIPGVTPHNFWLDEESEILFAGWYEAGLLAINVAGGLSGELHTQNRQIARAQPQGPNGPARFWAPQLHRGTIFASDLTNGLWSFQLQIND